MKKTAAIATWVMISAGSVGASALVPSLSGSDTLFDVTKDVLAMCPGAATLAYLGGGSGAGENAMRDGTQLIAPMSRALQGVGGASPSGVCKSTSNLTGDPTKAEGLTFALDGIDVTTSPTDSARCDADADGHGEAAINTTVAVNTTLGSTACPGCVGTSYTFGDWKDALKVLFAGVHHDSAATTDCNSAVRNSLAADFTLAFQTPCTTGTCTRVEHLWRRGDLSGTTDTFIGLLGLPALTKNASGTVTATPFCNGLESQDNDPIRRTCSTNDQACQALDNAATAANDKGTLGLLLPMFIPETVATMADAAYPITPCKSGVFKFRTASFAAQAAGRCPNGGKLKGGQCLTPLSDAFASGGHPSCRNTQFNCPAGTAFGTDCRVYNLELRLANQTSNNFVLDASGRQATFTFYRVRVSDALSTDTTNPGNPVCREVSDTRQIGCLSRTIGCTLGYAGGEASDPLPQGPGAATLALNNVVSSPDSVRRLLQSPVPANVYPLARRLWLNTMVGFENLVNARTTFTGVNAANDTYGAAQRSLASCFNDQTLVDPIVTARGFTTLGQPVQCVSFAEGACDSPATTTNADSCGDNGL